MPRYDDRIDSRDSRGGGTRLYVGRLSSRTRSRDLEDVFSRYGRVRDVDLKHDFAFVEFSDPRDADDARYSLDGRDVGGSRIIVEFAKGGPRGGGGGGGRGGDGGRGGSRGGEREYLGRGPPPGSGRCFNCGLDGHWARDCKAGDWKNKCYRCGDRGHIERNCQNSPKSLKRGKSYDRSPSRSASPRRGRSRSRSFSRSRSGSRSRSPVKRVRSIEREERRSRSPRDSRSPKRSKRTSPPPSKGRKRSPISGENTPRERGSVSPGDRRTATQRDGSDYSQSPRRAKSRSPISREASPTGRSPHKENGRGHSPSPPLNGKSPVGGDNDDNRHSPRGSE
ncbi:hypothetical protein MKX01_013959 [Papaver californicum]|nr:hypothetical protein MKX01_013959 [Papaver californicum]